MNNNTIRSRCWCFIALCFVLICHLGLGVSIDVDPVYYIDCGASQNSTLGAITWEGDVGSPYLSSDDKKQSVVAIEGGRYGDSSVSLQTILSTARFFTKPASYTFPVQPKTRLWIRLYFYPFDYPPYIAASASFSVIADSFVLISENTRIVAGSGGYVYKEFSVNVTNELLVIAIVPATSSYAFINAVEVVTIPAGYGKNPLGANTMVADAIIATSATETAFRVNVGGPLINSANDTMGRQWQSNQSYMTYNEPNIEEISIPTTAISYGNVDPHVAPKQVYATAVQLAPDSLGFFNISWLFPLPNNHNNYFYQYLLRLHFCEIKGQTTTQRRFNIYLQNEVALLDFDVYHTAQGGGKAVYLDFVVVASPVEPRLLLQVSPTPNVGASYLSAILNGIEIFKLNNSIGTLDGSNPASAIFIPAHLKESTSLSASIIIGIVVGGVALLVLILALFFWMYYHKSKPKPREDRPAQSPPRLPLSVYDSGFGISSAIACSKTSGVGSYVSSSAGSTLGKTFTFAKIQAMTNNLDEDLLIGVGGFGKVYKGELDDRTKVAVKRGNPRSQERIIEFENEIKMLSKLRHRHLVSLIGYCDEKNEMILVYEYMENGPLRSHLYGSNRTLPTLSWKQRLEICIGSARGLHYLHTGASQSIIHRDVKTTNIFLDENLVAKVSDFGLSRVGPTLDQTHVSTIVKGSFGYLDPEYFLRQQLTEKSDVYSFGVVLMEVLCARTTINPTLPSDEVNLAEWAMHNQKMGTLEKIIDPCLVGTINKASLKKFVEIAEKCLADKGIDRPTMGDVLWNLEYALQIQESAMSSSNINEANSNTIIKLLIHIPMQATTTTTTPPTGAMNNNNIESQIEDASGSFVFSQIIKPRGR